jgi:SpoVK/Ycf46/Vps4 family AAA+-type ATPase
MNNPDLLKMLFEAHRDGNEELFLHAAQSLIGRELASNHHEVAQQLTRALGPIKERTQQQRKLSALPIRGSSGDAVIVKHLDYEVQRPILSRTANASLDRLLAEHANRERLLAHGLRPTSRVLFWGPPGNGKTMAAFYVAQQLEMPVAVANLSGIISSLLGATATQLQQIFKNASERPQVLFLDEFDALGKERDDELEIGEPKRIVNSLLQSIDAFDSSRSILIAATNHQYVLDRAIWRRFDLVIEFSPPGPEERRTLLKRLLSGVKTTGPYTRSVSASTGLSYSDLTLATVDALKSMVLENRKTLGDTELVKSVTLRKQSVSSARKARSND